MRIALNRAHYPVTVLGPGTRIGLWVQGCTLRCPGCVSRDTWSSDEGREVDVADVVEWCRSVSPEGPDGITITGGEPFEQPLALEALTIELEKWRASVARPFDMLCYSGMPLKHLLEKHGPLVRRFDALMPEPFRQNLALGRLWAGSANQPLVLLTQLGVDRYEPYTTGRLTWRRSLQVSVGERAVWLLGIPDRGDLDQTIADCRDAGVHVEGLSWLA